MLTLSVPTGNIRLGTAPRGPRQAVPPTCPAVSTRARARAAA